MELSTWQTRENINFSDAAARLGPEVDDAMLQDHPKSGTAIDPFPAEIWHIICGNLNRDDLIALRSTSCAIADIAAEYLINTIHLDTSFEAFARLEEITGHPLLRKGVTKLVFEAGLLGNVGCVHNYSRHFDLDHHADFKPLPPLENERNERADRLFARNMAKFEKEVEQKYLAYRKVFEAQQLLVQGPKDHLLRGIEGLSNLEEVALQTDGLCSHTISQHFRDKYLTDCAIPIDRYSSHTVWQLEKMLRPGIKRLTARHLCPKFFNGEDERTVAWLRTIFEHLELLRLSFRQDHESDMEDDAALVPVGSRMLLNSQLSNVLDSAVNLKELRINFSGAERVAGNLANIMHQTSFPQLNRLDLDFFEAAEDSLLALLKAQPKLSKLELAFTVLTKGTWASLVRYMRSDLRLEECSLWGMLEDPSEIYSTDRCDRDMWANEGEKWTLSMALDIHITDRIDNYATAGFDNEEDFDLCCNPILRYEDDFADEEDLAFDFGPTNSDKEDELDDSDDSSAPSTDSDGEESLPDLEDIATTPMSLD